MPKQGFMKGLQSVGDPHWSRGKKREERSSRKKLQHSDCSPCLALLSASVVELSVACVDWKGRGVWGEVKPGNGGGKVFLKCLFLYFCFPVTKSALVYINLQQIKLT